jgi:hypothetical protein
MKHWFAAVLAALIVLVAGTAVASIPSGSSSSFSVGDPAVTAIGSGQTPGTGGAAEVCSWSAEATTFCASPVTFTPAADATCMVSTDLALYGDPMGTVEADLDQVSYGIAVEVEEESQQVDQNGVTSTPNATGEQTVSRTRLIPVQAGIEYTFQPWVTSHATSTGSAYWDLAFACFG